MLIHHNSLPSTAAYLFNSSASPWHWASHLPTAAALVFSASLFVLFVFWGKTSKSLANDEPEWWEVARLGELEWCFRIFHTGVFYRTLEVVYCIVSNYV